MDACRMFIQTYVKLNICSKILGQKSDTDFGALVHNRSLVSQEVTEQEVEIWLEIKSGD